MRLVINPLSDSPLPDYLLAQTSQYRELIWGETDSGEKFNNQNDDSFSPSYSLFRIFSYLSRYYNATQALPFYPLKVLNPILKTVN